MTLVLRATSLYRKDGGKAAVYSSVKPKVNSELFELRNIVMSLM